MKLGLIKQISKEDLGADAPAWAEKLIGPLNQFITQVGTALQNRLDFENNFSANVFNKKLSSGVEQEVNPQSDRLRVKGVLPLYADGAVIDKFGWSYKSNGNIGVSATFDGGGSKTVRLLILLG